MGLGANRQGAKPFLVLELDLEVVEAGVLFSLVVPHLKRPGDVPRHRVNLRLELSVLNRGTWISNKPAKVLISA